MHTVFITINFIWFGERETDKTIEQTLKSLRANYFNAEFAENLSAARNIILDIIQKEATVGIGDSATIRQICILEEIERKGIKIVNPVSKEIIDKVNDKLLDQEGWISLAKKAIRCDVFLTGSNAVTMDGKLVNIDGAGNRVVGMIFGPKHAIIVAGRNKIVKDVSEALYRIKNIIVPAHAGPKNKRPPCTITGKCSDCNFTNEKMCKITTIIEMKPHWSEITVIIVNEDLGLGWSENWPAERIDKIHSEYFAATYPLTR